MAGLGAKDILRNITALEQLIEEINFQRAKEMRQCLMSKDADASFVIVHGTTYWTDLFVRHFLFQTDRSTDADDLLFFIRKKQVHGPRYVPKYKTEVEVYRKDSRKLPIGDPDVDWEETVYLNLIIHQFDYTLTLAICTRTSPKELQVLKRHSQKVYASPSRRRMDTKGEVEEITYPNVCFHVDNFDEVFADMLVRDGEMVCVELVAADHAGSRQAVIFLGSIRYDALKRVYDTRASLSSKVAQRMMMGLFSGGGSQRIEFVRMKGPQGKGHAEMAVTKPKGSGVETPTSEPGVSLTDLWDSDWEDEPEDRFLYRHQRRLSDPSANFNTFINSGWVSKAEGKSRSENEGLDNFANGLYEIESGDVRDGPAGTDLGWFAYSVSGWKAAPPITQRAKASRTTQDSSSLDEGKTVCSCRCCSVVACRRLATDEDEASFDEEGLCKRCRHFHGKQGLSTRFQNHSSSEEGECDSNGGPTAASGEEAGTPSEEEQSEELVVGVEASEMLGPGEMEEGEGFHLKSELTQSENPTEEDPFILPSVSYSTDQTQTIQSRKKEKYSASESPSRRTSRLGSLLRKRKRIATPGSAVRVESTAEPTLLSKSAPTEYIPLSTREDIAIAKEPHSPPCDRIPCLPPPLSDDPPMAGDRPPVPTLASGPIYFRSYSVDAQKLKTFLSTTAPAMVKSRSLDDVESFPGRKLKRRISIPFRVTKDGTRVYFRCDTKLDDGAYNPLWTTKGFTQTFHFWKESRRAQSVPLNAYLTYVTLPWFTIITDILDHRTGPILTF